MTCERPYVRRLKVGKAVVPAAARAPHARPPPCRPRLGPRDEGAAAPVVPAARGLMAPWACLLKASPTSISYELLCKKKSQFADRN